LPNFAKLIRNGVSGKHNSIKPLISPMIWATIFTGKAPEKHGIKDFYVNTIKTKQMWEILHESGDKIGIFNPITAFDSQVVNGFFVPGCLTPIVSAYPPDLKFLQELSIKVRNGEMGVFDLFPYAVKLLRQGCRVTTLLKVTLNYLLVFISSANPFSLDNLYKLKESESLVNSDIFIYYAKKYNPDFMLFFDNGIDTVSHWYWKYMEPEVFDDVNKESISKYRNVIKNYYKRIDEIVGRIVETGGDDATFIIISDHGFEACHEPKGVIRGEIFVNTLLDYLDLKDKVYGIKLGYSGLFRPKGEIKLEEIEDLFKKVRFKNTRQPVFKVDHVDSYIRVRINVKSITNKKEKVIFPNYLECTLNTIVNFNPSLSGKHHPCGVFIINGPDIMSGISISDVSVFDIAPTILALKKIPIPDDMDGKVLTKIFKIPIKEEDLKHVPSYDSKTSITRKSGEEKLSKQSEEYIQNRLRELGYL
jgi:predicted AlkP superfamily phosphohydrolase/phosphomutase